MAHLRIEDLVVYQRLCQLHLEVCELSHDWPSEERFELGGQVRRSSNSSPANLAEKHSDRHIRNKIEGANRARGEALETVHHLYMANLKGYIAEGVYTAMRDRYLECVRMLNGMEKTLEKNSPGILNRWEKSTTQSLTSDSEPLNPEP